MSIIGINGIMNYSDPFTGMYTGNQMMGMNYNSSPMGLGMNYNNSPIGMGNSVIGMNYNNSPMGMGMNYNNNSIGMGNAMAGMSYDNPMLGMNYNNPMMGMMNYNSGQMGMNYNNQMMGMNNTNPYYNTPGLGNTTAPVLALFRQLDRNGNGVITEEDFVILVHQLGLGIKGQVLAKIAFRKLDKNRNGVLEFNEALSAIGLLKNMK